MTPRRLTPLGDPSEVWARFAEVAGCGDELRERLAPILDLSPYLLACALAYPADALAAARGEGDAVFASILAEAPEGDRASVMRALRIAKRRVALVAGICDLLKLWPTMVVTQRLTDFADHAVRHALAAAQDAMIARSRLAARSGIGVVAMGKFGAGELNYSSDIDIVVFLDPDDAAFPDRDEALDTAVRITRDLVAILQDRTADGYVFRTDLRLRPDPGSMPLAITVAMAARYYEGRGQNWERAAYIKARHCAGDPEVSDEVLAGLVPFRWRRYLDFAAIADIHSIKRQIQAHKDALGFDVPGHNVKLGRGGIREIEFFVQTQQLIAGGRDPDLRGRRTLRMLDALARTGWIERNVRDDLRAAYLALRDVEHRIQMVHDAQEHRVPTDPQEMLRIARMCGYDDAEIFVDEVSGHLRRVEAHYATLFENEDPLSDEGSLSFTGDEPDPDTIETLAGMGFARPRDMIAVVRGWHYGRARAMASAAAREELTAMTPMLLAQFARTGRPDEALLAFDTFLSGLPAGIQLFAILRANPDLARLLIDILGSAPRLAAIVARRPHVVDSLIEPRFFETLPSRALLAEEFEGLLALAASYEDALDRVRLFAAEQRFLIGVRLLGAAISPRRAGEAFSELAEVVLAGLLPLVEAEVARRFGTLPGWRFAILAMGRLGSRELTAGSDLDLVFLYDADMDAASSGPKALAASEYAVRFVQTLVSAMSAPTAQGTAYELDFRLRPSGNSGPLATTVAAFRRHQLERAKVWEHLALTRARIVSGDATLSAEAQAIVERAISLPRDRAHVVAEVRDMRSLMDAERPGTGPFDVKLAPGGLVDLEFIAQFAALVGDVERDESVRSMLAGLDRTRGGTRETTFATLTDIAQLARVALDGPLDRDAPRGFVDRLLRETGDPDLATLEARLAELRRETRADFEAYLQ